MEDKTKVVLLTHYWSDEMAEMVGRKHYFRELAPWIQETINLFKDKNDVDFHVVAPNYASNILVECERQQIHFHFYHYSPTLLSRISAPLVRLFVNHSETFKIAERLANVLTGFRTPTVSARRLIRNINPDLIHLYGSENPDYSAPAIKLLGEYPVLLTVQGYVYLHSKSKKPLNRLFQLYRLKYEREINRSVRFLTSSEAISIEELKNNNTGFWEKCEKIFCLTPITKVPKVCANKVGKEYDVVFYARINKIKGIEDLIDVVSYLKEKGRLLKTLIMGRGGDAYVDYIKKKVADKGCSGIVTFAGFIENHEEVYLHAAKARVLVLPSHSDGTPNTIREAMFMKLPVVANNVGGIPTFNAKRHCIHLVKFGDIEDLANGICKVLDDDIYREELICNAYSEAYEVFSPDAIYGQLLFAYKDIFSKK